MVLNRTMFEHRLRRLQTLSNRLVDRLVDRLVVVLLWFCFWGHSWDASVLAAAPVYLQDHHGPKRCVVRQTSSDLDGGVIVQMSF